MSNIARRAALTATAMAVVMTTPAFAQDAQMAEGASDGTIIVTARRMEENLQDVPISITVFSQEEIDQRNITNSTELAAYTPSLNVNARFGPEKSSFVIRGFSQDLNTQPTVAVYFADAVAPRLSSNITSGNGAGVGDMFDLQNVQVLKGPQGTLFGRNTTGGAILLVPQKPTGDLEGYIEGTYGNFDQKRVQAVLNVPLADTFKVRAGVDWNKRDGYLNNRSGIGPDDFNNVNYFAARLSILAELTPTLENYTIFKYAKSDVNGSLMKLAYCDPTAGTLLGGFICAQADQEAADGFGFYDVQNTALDPHVDNKTWQVINTTTWEASDTLTIKNIISYGEARESYSFNLDGDFTPFPFVTTNPGPNRPQGNQWTFTEELQFQGRTSNDKLTWQAGGYTEISDPIGGVTGQAQYTEIFGGCSDVYNFVCNPFILQLPPAFGGPRTIGSVSAARNTYYYRNYGLYAQATYDITEQFAITGGFRYTWDKQRQNADNVAIRLSPIDGTPSFSCTRAPTPPGSGPELEFNQACTRVFEQKSSDPTWLINLDYKPNDDILLYAKYARGYRAGGVNESNIGIETWDPERVDSYELGAKTTIRGGSVRGTFNLAGFWNDFNDQQASVFVPQCIPGPNNPECTAPSLVGINGIQNVGKSRLKGIEAEANLTFFDSFRLNVGYAYLDAKVRSVSTPMCERSAFDCDSATFFANPGERLNLAPKNRVTITGTYTLPLDESLGDLSIGATFVHTDKQKFSTSSKAPFEAGLVPFDAGILPSTDLLNLNIDWKSVGGSPIDLSLFATNVTKEKYWVASANGYPTLGAEFIQLGQPRFYGARIRFNFGQ